MDSLDQIDEALGSLSSNQRPQTAADQPTTEPRWGVAKFRYDHTRCACGGFDLDYLITGWSQGDQVVQDVIRHPAQRVHHRGCEKAPAPQPDTETETERDEHLRDIQERVDLADQAYRMLAFTSNARRRAHEASASDVPWLLAEVTRLDAVVTAVRDLHRVQWDHCQGCYDSTGRLVAYPCPTVRALDGVL